MWSPLLAAAVDGPRAERVRRGGHAHALAELVGAGLERTGARHLLPHLERERGTDHAARLQLVAGLPRAPPGLDLDGDAGALTAGRVELPEEPATRHEEREDEDGEDADDRPRAASAAGPVGADPGPWPPRRRTTSGPSTPWDRFGGRFGNRTRRIGRRIGGFGEPARRIGRRIGGFGRTRRAESVGESADSVNPGAESVGESVPRNSGVGGLAERPSHDSSWPPSSVGVTRAARTAERRATTAGSPPPPRRRCRRAGRAGDGCAGESHLGGCAGRSSW